jgi:membrane protein implicated in regulation of membrane protease activity
MAALTLPWWGWMTAGFALMALEMLVPGVYLLWMGLAGVIGGLLLAFLPPVGAAVQLGLFAGLAALSILLARYLSRRQVHPDQVVNDRGGGLIGRVMVLSEAITDGVGRAKEADGSWRVLGPDLPVHAKVRVTAVEGGSLRVEAAD